MVSTSESVGTAAWVSEQPLEMSPSCGRWCSSSAHVRHHRSSDCDNTKVLCINVLNWDETRRELYEGIIVYSNSVKEGFNVL